MKAVYLVSRITFKYSISMKKNNVTVLSADMFFYCLFECTSIRLTNTIKYLVN